jgi:hypothetical protein
MRRGPFIRVRRYDQRPSGYETWAEWPADNPDNITFCGASNACFERDRRMQSWRRPL